MTDAKSVVRPLNKKDLDAVVNIDTKTSGTTRRRFFEKRLQFHLSEPEAYISLGIEVNGALEGFGLGHLLNGEFGSDHPVVVLEAIGVNPGEQGHGYGHQVIDQMIAEAKEKGARELQTVVEWNDPVIVVFLSQAGFTLAPRIVLERETHLDQY